MDLSVKAPVVLQVPRYNPQLPTNGLTYPGKTFPRTQNGSHSVRSCSQALPVVLNLRDRECATRCLLFPAETGSGTGSSSSRGRVKHVTAGQLGRAGADAPAHS